MNKKMISTHLNKLYAMVEAINDRKATGKWNEKERIHAEEACSWFYSDLAWRFDRKNNAEEFQKIEEILEKTFPSEIPEIGNATIGYKIVEVEIEKRFIEENGDEVYIKRESHLGMAKLLIPPEANRLQSFNRKCRCDRALVEEIRVKHKDKILNAQIGYSSFTSKMNRLCYLVGLDIIPNNYDDNRWIECSNGIHFFMTPKEAADFVFRNGKINVIPNDESYDIKQVLEGLFEEGE